MNRFALAATAALLATAMVAGVSDAAAARGFTRVTHVQGANGRGYTHTGYHNCAAGSCTGDGSTVGNYRGYASHTSSATYGNGAASWQSSGSNARGGSYSRSGSCAAGAGCAHSGSYTDAAGQTWTHTGSTTPQ